MVVSLTVQDIAIIEKAHVEFDSGLTVFTGETGAGKSLLFDALGLVLGDRADLTLLRQGAEKAVVTLVVQVPPRSTLADRLEAMDCRPEDGQLVLSRELSSEGRSTAKLDGRPVALSQLREIGRLLVDLHTQHEHQRLFDPDSHVEFLDGLAGSADLLDSVAQAWGAFSQMKSQLESLRRSGREREQRVDTLRYQIDELESLSPRAGELAEIESKLSVLQASAKLRACAARAIEDLTEAEGSAAERLARALREYEVYAEIDESMRGEAEALGQARVVVSEASARMAEAFARLELDEREIESIAARQDAIRRAVKKYAEDESGLLEHLDSCREELATLTGEGADEQGLERACELTQSRHLQACEKLTSLRRATATKLERGVVKELEDLGMTGAKFVVRVGEGQPGPSGADAVEFLFSANVGEHVKPLEKVASGGEASRLMLALKVVLAESAEVPCLVFDEVDAGLSGRAAAIVGAKLLQISDKCQVLAVTHLPQIAGLADTHFAIEKSEAAGRTTTTLKGLEGKERVDELARLLAGETIGDHALANAREILASARCR